nr:copia protein [Tanacetum cinerariifolium]
VPQDYDSSSAMPCLFIHVIYTISLSLYPFTERYAQPYFFSCLIRQRGVTVVVRNKARLVAKGDRQEEGIDYDEVFALVARIEAIRIFLAFASYMGFIVYLMDVKSAFMYGTINEEVYVSQPPSFVDFKFPNKKSWCDEFEELMMNSVKTASTPIETQKLLVKDEEVADVDVTPKTLHLHAVKRIFRNHFIRDAYEKKLIHVPNIHTNDNVVDLLTNAFDVSSKELASPKQMALGKDISNSLLAGRLPKTTLPTSTLLKNFDKEDLESLWKLVKERFEKTEPKNYTDDYLLKTLKILFKHLDVEASVWRDQKGRYGLVKRYPLTHFTLEQMLNNVRLEVEKESEISLDLLRRLDDARDGRLFMSGQLNLLRKDRRSHARTTRLLESEARASHWDWRFAGYSPQTTGIAYRGTDSAEDIVDSYENDTNEKKHKGISSHDNHHHTCHNAQLKVLIDQGVVDALAACNANRSRNGNDSHNSRCVVEGQNELLTVFNISNYAVENQVKFSTCTLHGVTLTWWKSHVKTAGQDAAHGIS